ncbi:SET domain-containing protein [Polyporus arcularius HHB13444]|uniref:SET domain-containing protein n=1 Tax=Polyporus arcularius HHB13444 TaxID=1314778 RepID=A0A5C3P240_9APHY|nr:SET domain-containing protein [Polyporus arcularius HHB13444]
MSKRIDRFFRWLSENDIQVDPGISIVQAEAGITVHSTAAFNNFARAVAAIPKSAVLSVRTCTLSEQISWVPYGHGAVLAMSLALYSEILSGAQSRWFDYLQSLPAKIVPIARLWGHPAAFPNGTDAHEACNWIHGTEVQRELQDDDGALLVAEIDDYYKFDVEPLLFSHDLVPSLSGFLHAYSLVCSRAFLVDAYHGLSMVPVADAFNHAQNNHVQLASEYDVCPECGSLAECPHDQEDSIEPSRHEHPAEDVMDTVDMVAVRPIPAGVEIFNTYGAHLGNAALLARYGFVLDGCEADKVTFGWPGSGLVLRNQHEDFVEIFQEVKSGVGPLVDVSSSLYESGDDTKEPSLSVNSDGQASLGLFVWAARNVALDELSSPPQAQSVIRDAISGLLIRTFSVLLQLEIRRNMDSDVDADPITDALQILVKSAGTISDLCRTRLGRAGHPEHRIASSQMLGELLDDLPPEKCKIRYALEYLLNERAILEACATHWEELRDIVGEVSRPGLQDEVSGYLADEMCTSK